MTVDMIEKLKDCGWYITEHGYDIASDSENITDIQKVIKRLLDIDLREVGSGQGDITQGNIVLQIQKMRNVAAPKSNEESRTAPRMLKLSLTDGKNNLQAIEVDHISSISLNTPPGTKILIKPGNVLISHGMLLLRPAYMVQVLGGVVTSLVEKWELNKKLALHTRVRPTEDGGPPPWIPFGKKIIKVLEHDKNFKALAEKDKSTKENAVFEAQRKDAIAEAAKQGSKKVFGGGTKQLLDHSVQKIIDQGFTIEQAEYALKISKNNVDKALKTLQKTDNKHPAPKETREPRNKRSEKKSEESKPSSGKISLFDFLEDKLPVQPETSDASSFLVQNSLPQTSDSSYNKIDLKNTDSGKGPRSQKGTRGGYQAPPRHQEESKNTKRAPTNSYSQYNGAGSTQQNKPPRFQRSQDTQSYYNDAGTRSYQKAQTPDYRNLNSQQRTESSMTDSTQYSKSQDQQAKPFNANKGYNHLDTDPRNKNVYDASYGRHNRAQADGTHRAYLPSTNDKNYKNQLNRYQPNDNSAGRGAIGPNSQRSDSHYNSSQSASSPQVENTWVWRIGDKCLAKYWEDNRYYSAEVTDVSDRTCVVQFKGFENYEEVLQTDCIPITDDYQVLQDGVEPRRSDPRPCTNRQQPQYDQSYNHIGDPHFAAGLEFRRGGSGAAPVSKGYGKKRTQQRSAQPIYQPPAQRNQNSMSMNTQHNSLL